MMILNAILIKAFTTTAFCDTSSPEETSATITVFADTMILADVFDNISLQSCGNLVLSSTLGIVCVLEKMKGLKIGVSI